MSNNNSETITKKSATDLSGGLWIQHRVTDSDAWYKGHVIINDEKYFVAAWFREKDAPHNSANIALRLSPWRKRPA